MKRVIAILLMSVPCFATGPKYLGSKADPTLYQETVNIYHDIANPTITKIDFADGTSQMTGSNTLLTSTQTWTGVNTYTSSVTVKNTLGATTFMDTSGRSIYGNFVASNSVVGGSSVNVTLSGYTQYHVKIMLNNVTGSKGSVFLRLSGDSGNNYSYSSSGFHLTVSTGSSCGNVAASAFVLTTTGDSHAANNFNNAVEFSASFDVGTRNNNQIEGISKYQETSANSIVNLSFGGYQNSGTLTSIQSWIGVASSCTGVTDPLTGTTGSIWVWGVF